ncbi:MAG: hypothetical protein FJX22_01860 [Alphaproteobacteria bacterium]|nr:hypothetical protein [Alphaproteobacteria bacterium]
MSMAYTPNPLHGQNRRWLRLSLLLLLLGGLLLVMAVTWRDQQQQRLQLAKQDARLTSQQLANLQAWQQRIPTIGAYQRQSLASPLTAQAVALALAKLRQDPTLQKLHPQLSDPQVGEASYPLEQQLLGKAGQALRLNAFRLQLTVKSTDDWQGRRVLVKLAAQLPGFVIPLQLSQKPLPDSEKSPALVETQWQLLLIGLADPLPAWPSLGEADADSVATGTLAADPSQQDAAALQDDGLDNHGKDFQGDTRPLLTPLSAGLSESLTFMAHRRSLGADGQGGDASDPGGQGFDMGDGAMRVGAILYLNPDRWSFWLNGQKYDSGSPSIRLGDWRLLTVSPQSLLWQHSGDGRLLTLHASLNADAARFSSPASGQSASGAIYRHQANSDDSSSDSSLGDPSFGDPSLGDGAVGHSASATAAPPLPVLPPPPLSSLPTSQLVTPPSAKPSSKAGASARSPNPGLAPQKPSPSSKPSPLAKPQDAAGGSLKPAANQVPTVPTVPTGAEEDGGDQAAHSAVSPESNAPDLPDSSDSSDSDSTYPEMSEP